jgi:hypothetical protein
MFEKVLGSVRFWDLNLNIFIPKCRNWKKKKKANKRSKRSETNTHIETIMKEAEMKNRSTNENKMKKEETKINENEWIKKEKEGWTRGMWQATKKY